MIIQNVNNRLRVIYTPDKKADFDIIARELGYLELGKPKKGVDINRFSSFHPMGGTASLSSIEIKDSDGVAHIVDNSTFFDYNGDNVGAILHKLKTFGNKYTLNIDNKLFDGELYKESDIAVKNNKGNTIIFESDPTAKMTLKMHDFMHKMRMNNSRMIMPLIRKYADTITLLKSKRHLLTGYANMLDYMDFMKSPNREFLLNLTGKTGDCRVEFKRGSSRITLKVSGVIDDRVKIDFMVNNSLYVSTKNQNKSPVPYILLNTKPIQMLNQKMIYFTAKYKKNTVFVIPIMMKSDTTLKKLRGGFNLLS